MVWKNSVRRLTAVLQTTQRAVLRRFRNELTPIAYKLTTRGVGGLIPHFAHVTAGVFTAPNEGPAQLT